MVNTATRFIAIDGLHIDSTYRSTVCNHLYNMFEGYKYRVYLHKFPDPNAVYGHALYDMFNNNSGIINTAIGIPLVNTIDLSLILELNRISGLSRIDYSNYDIVIFDTYYPSGLVFAKVRNEDTAIIQKYFLPVYPKADIFILDKVYNNTVQTNTLLCLGTSLVRNSYLHYAENYGWNVIRTDNISTKDIAKEIFDIVTGGII